MGEGQVSSETPWRAHLEDVETHSEGRVYGSVKQERVALGTHVQHQAPRKLPACGSVRPRNKPQLTAKPVST